jgi:hypothetical protein
MEKDNILTDRVSQDYSISETSYITGVVEITEYLFIELIDLLKTEDRCFGIVKSYINSMKGAYEKVCESLSDEDIDISDRILYLYKPLILKEFARLKNRRLSPADSAITLIHRLLDIISNIDSEYEFKSELGTLEKVIGKLWDNIRNKSKNDSLYYFSDILRTNMSKGLIGKFTLSHISLKEEVREKQLLKNPGVRVKQDSEKKIIEINLM